MSSASTSSRFQASIGAFKTIYYVIVGLAITTALSRVFVDHGAFVGSRLLEQDNGRSLPLLVAFLATVLRFTHGASIHLDVIHTARSKALADFLGFLVQASLFYVMALSLEQAETFSYFLIAMLTADALWLAALCVASYIPFPGTARQWIWSDVIIIVLVSILLWRDPQVGPLTAWLIMAISLSAAVVDYRMNWEFYFPAAPTAK